MNCALHIPEQPKGRLEILQRYRRKEVAISIDKTNLVSEGVLIDHYKYCLHDFSLVGLLLKIQAGIRVLRKREHLHAMQLTHLTFTGLVSAFTIPGAGTQLYVVLGIYAVPYFSFNSVQERWLLRLLDPQSLRVRFPQPPERS